MLIKIRDIDTNWIKGYTYIRLLCESMRMGLKISRFVSFGYCNLGNLKPVSLERSFLRPSGWDWAIGLAIVLL
jgi:hypothetical protein